MQLPRARAGRHGEHCRSCGLRAEKEEKSTGSKTEAVREGAGQLPEVHAGRHAAQCRTFGAEGPWQNKRGSQNAMPSRTLGSGQYGLHAVTTGPLSAQHR